MPTIFGWDNRRLYSLTRKAYDDSRGFRTETCVLRDALREYEQQCGASVVPQPAREDDPPDQASRFVSYRGPSGDAFAYCVIVISRDGEESFELGNDFDVVLHPDDIVEISPTAC
ncbi:MAG TPA: hypothetical protein VJ724_01845 [Tahibacter sp.]|nr:hypothetical protein [Tahibacter sp.]